MVDYRKEIKSKSDFNKVRKILVESELVTLATYGKNGQAYILSGLEPLPSFDADAYVAEVSKRQVGMLNSNSVRLSSSYSLISLKLDSILSKNYRPSVNR